VDPRVRALGAVTRVNSGTGDPVGGFAADGFFYGGWDSPYADHIDTNGVANAAPEEVYQSERWGNFTYTFSGLSPGVKYTVRLHFAEVYFDVPGGRIFNVGINGTPALENFDLVAIAGPNKAVVREFTPPANEQGQIVLSFVGVADVATLGGVELIPPNQAAALTEALFQLNAGGEAAGAFGADQYVTGGSSYSVSGAVQTSGVANAAPMEVYQSERFGDHIYTLEGLTPGAMYTVRLHFAEIYHDAPGRREFNVAINDKTVLARYDIFREVGGYRAVVKDFSAFANDEGEIVVSLTTVFDNAKLSGLEVLRDVARTPPSLPGRNLGAGRHPLAAGCNANAVVFAESTNDSAALYLSTFNSSGQAMSSVRVAEPHVSSPDPGVAALPGDDFVVAWTDFDDDELGILLRKVVGGVVQGKPVLANEDPAFSQSASDIVFDGTHLVVAWTDSHDPVNGPDLHYRLFTPELQPLTGDQVLAATATVEDNVVLAGRNGHWAAAWRAGSQGMETIEVQSGSSHWTVGPFSPGATDNRPDLIFLDETHLAVAFTMGTDPGATGVANVARVHAAILDPATPGLTASFAIPPAQDPYSSARAIEQTQPSLVLRPSEIVVSWHSGAAPGDAKGEELWLRHVPYSVASDGAITLDPSHVEVPLVRTAAQRVGDQSAFRMIATSALGGGLIAAWQDQARTFGSSAGAPDVVLQFMPEITEPPPAVTTYPLSPNGKYYLVNVLQRNYPGPTVNVTYANDARLWAGQFPPEAIFNGVPSGHSWTTPAANDPDATVVMTVDMGQYFSVGAILPFYFNSSATPMTTQIRLASELGNWTTVVPANTPVPAYAIYEVDPPVRARFVEITQVGTGPSNRILLSELMVFPSSQQSPPPTSADGYDLGSLATTTVSPNLVSPSPLVPPVWPAGNAAAGPTGRNVDAFVNLDFRAQYPVTRLETCFLNPWETGGRLDIAAVPGLFQTLVDSGLGQPFPLGGALCQIFPLPGQPMRYVRATNYAAPSTGISVRTMSGITAFTTPKPLTAYYPLSADRKYFIVNNARRPTGAIQPTATVVYANGAVPHPTSLVQNPANAVDGSDQLAFYWYVPSGDFTTATATVTVDLGKVESLGAIRELYQNAPPLSTSLRVSQNSTGPWTTVRNDLPVTSQDITTSFDALSVRYIEHTMKGTTDWRIVNLNELVTYPSATTSDPAPNSTSRLDLSYLPGMSVSMNANMGLGGGAQIHYVPGNAAYYVKSAADGATGDAIATIDFGQPYSISELRLIFYSNLRWMGGGKVDVDDGSGRWINVFDSGRGTALGRSSDGMQTMLFAPHLTRYLRLTGYFDPALPRGYLINMEVY